jgi:hypothetical protein
MSGAIATSGHIERRHSRRRPQIGDDLVEKRQDRPYVALTISVVLSRPLRQRRPGLLRNFNGPSSVGRHQHFAKHAGSAVAQELKVVLSSLLHVPLISGGRGVFVGARPINGVGRKYRDMQAGLRLSPRDHRKHHSVVKACELAVTDDAGAIREEQAKEQVVSRRDAEAGRHARAHREHACSEGHSGHKYPAEGLIVTSRQGSK